MDTWTILWIILVILVIGSFAILIIFNNKRSALEKGIKEAIGQAGWKIHDDLITGMDGNNHTWQISFSGEGINRALHWTTTSVHLRKGVLVIMPAASAEIFSGANRRLAYRLTGTGKNWLEDGMKTLQLATSRGKALKLGSDDFQKRFSIYGFQEGAVQGLITPEIEAMLANFPNMPGQPPAPVYVFVNRTSLQVNNLAQKVAEIPEEITQP
jgi:hypothetical protein